MMRGEARLQLSTKYFNASVYHYHPKLTKRNEDLIAGNLQHKSVH